MIYRVKIFVLSLALISTATYAQKMSCKEAIQAALKNNDRLKAEEYHIEQARQLKKAQTDLGKFSATLMKGEYNTIQQDNNVTFSQSIPFPSALIAQNRLGKEQVLGAERSLALEQNNLVYEVRLAYELLLYHQALQQLLLSQDTLFANFARVASVRYKTGEGTLLEKTTAESQHLEIKNQLQQNEADRNIVQKRLQVLVNTAEVIQPNEDFVKRTLTQGTLTNNPTWQYELQQTNISRQALRVERNRFLPDLELGYFNQTLIGFQNTTGTEEFYDKSKRFQGFIVGVSFPLWFAPQTARAKAAFYQHEAAQKTAGYTQALITQEYEQAMLELRKNETSLAYYEQSALQNAALILSQATKSFQTGEIGYAEYLQSLRTAIGIKANYLMALQQYNLSIIKIESLTGTI